MRLRFQPEVGSNCSERGRLGRLRFGKRRMPATSLVKDLITTAPVLTDGAWGTELQARGLPAGEIGDLRAWRIAGRSA